MRIIWLLVLCTIIACSGHERVAESPVAEPRTTPSESEPEEPEPLACPELNDREGWFALGDSTLPPPVIPAGGHSSVSFSHDGTPIAAGSTPDRQSVWFASAKGGQLEVERMDVGAQVSHLSLGAGAGGPVIAVVTGERRMFVFRREQDQWKKRSLPMFCVGDTGHHFGGMPDHEILVDQTGDVWIACIERRYIRTDGPCVGACRGKLVSTRLKFGRRVGRRWLGKTSKIPHLNSIELATSASSELLVRLGSSAKTHIATIPFGKRSGPLRVRLSQPTPPQKLLFGGSGTGWLSVDGAGTENCSQGTPCELQAKVGAPASLPDFPIPLGSLSGLAHRNGVWAAIWMYPVKGTANGASVALFDPNDGWRPLVGKIAPGVSATTEMADIPSIALDECGRPTVMWYERQSTVLRGRSFKNGVWNELPSIPNAGFGPAGLTYAKSGLYVGLWQQNDYFVHQIKGRNVSELPPIRLGSSEWTVIDKHRTRLSFDGLLHFAVPIREHALEQPKNRAGYVFQDEQWHREKVPLYLLKVNSNVKSMPWGTDQRISDNSALAIDEEERRIVVWPKGETLGVAWLDGSDWRTLSDIPAIPVSIPAIAADGGRMCVAWSGISGLTADVYVRCHRGLGFFDQGPEIH